MKTQKHLGPKLDEKLRFKKQLRNKFSIVNEGIEMLKKLSNYFPRYSLVTLYKAFIRSHIDYVDVIYDKPNNMNICNNLAAIIWVIRGSSKEKLYLELGFEYLNLRR